MNNMCIKQTGAVILSICLLVQTAAPWTGVAFAQEITTPPAASPSPKPTDSPSSTPALQPTTPPSTISPSPSSVPTAAATPSVSTSPGSTVSPQPTGAETMSPTPVPETTLSSRPTLLPSPFAQPSITDGLDRSASIRQRMKLLAFTKRNLSAGENVKVNILYAYDEHLTISVQNTRGDELPVGIEKQTNGDETTFILRPPAGFKPGRYRFQITDSTGKVQQQDFTWGVLAINTDRSLYAPGETVHLALAVLDETGVMVCNSHLGVDITSPSGVKTTLGTWDRTITVNPECEIHDVTEKPDYETSYTIGSESGRYRINVTAETHNGTWTIEDGFDVREAPLYVISRSSATRIVPTKQYDMALAVTTQKDFSGIVQEVVPGNFRISAPYDHSLRSFDHVASVSASLPATAVASAPAPIPIGPLHQPYQGSYTQTLGFGEVPESPLLQQHYRRFGLPAHDGIDISLPSGTPVLAADDGEVIFANDGPYGITVILRHTWGQSYYGHLSKTGVEVTQKVKKGNQIALSGSTGFTTGPHLHFAIRPEAASRTNGYFGKVDPLPYMEDYERSSLYAATTVQRIYWRVTIKAGETIHLGYRYDAPDVSPQLYLLGPARLQQQERPALTPDDQSVPIDPSLLEPPVVSTPSATAAPSTPPSSGPSATLQPDDNRQSDRASASASLSTEAIESTQSGLSIASLAPSLDPQPLADAATSSAGLGLADNTPLFDQLFQVAPGQTVYEESRHWQIAADADVLIDASASTTQTRQKDKPHLVFISDQVGYMFYTDSGSFDCSYMKTTDGGATWGTETNVIANGCNTVIVWYDRWTPGDNTGTYIHIVGFDQTNSDLIYNRLDTANGADTLLGVTIADNPAATLTDSDTLAITKSTSGVLYIGYTDAGAAGVSKIRQCSTSCGTNTNWSNVGTSPLDQASDFIRLLPLSGGSIMLIEDDISADTIRYNSWNGSAWAGWTNFDTTAVDSTSYKESLAATLRRWNNNVYLVYIANVAGAGTADIRTAIYNGSSWTQKTEVLSDQNTVINADIAVDEESGDVYVSYIRGTAGTSTNVYYKKSTDGMATWGSEVQLNTSNSNADNRDTWLNMVNSDRIYFSYVQLTLGEMYGGTVVNLTPPVLDEIMKHGEWWSRTGIRKSFSF